LWFLFYFLLLPSQHLQANKPTVRGGGGGVRHRADQKRVREAAESSGVWLVRCALAGADAGGRVSNTGSSL